MKLIRIQSIALLITCMFFAKSPCFAEQFDGKCVRVLDGDTIEVLHDGRPERVRLNGIDCPEKSQAFGMRAKQFTADLVWGQNVTVSSSKTDRYGRTIGEVLLPDGRDVNAELVRSGYAWWYRKYSSDQHLGELERSARSERLGIWSGADPVPPWEFRHNKRSSPIIEPLSTANFKTSHRSEWTRITVHP